MGTREASARTGRRAPTGTPGAGGEPDTLARERAAHARRLEESVRELTRKLAGLPGVRRVSLFGSYAKGRADLFTDLDVLVVMDTDESFVERLASLYRYLALPVDLDLLCYTPEEFETMRDRPFLRRVLEEEVVLHEARAG